MYFRNNLNIIFAITNNRYFIGQNNQLPCNIPEDMKFFKSITIGNGNNAIIMGKNTFLSLPSKLPLSNRLNIIVSTTYINTLSYNNLIVVPSLKEAVNVANQRDCQEIFFIGGTQIIVNAFSEFVIKKIYVFYIHSDFTTLKNNIETTHHFFFLTTIQESKKYSETLIDHISKDDYFVNFKLYERLSEEMEYLNIVRKVLDFGKPRIDRTKVGTLSLFAQSFELDVSHYFPLLTSKRMYWKGIVEELLFFLRGETDSKILENKGVYIWRGNTTRDFLDNLGLFHLREGEMGPTYSWNYRRFGAPYIPLDQRKEDEKLPEGIDQVQNAIDLIKNDPTSRRILVSAWNPSVLKEVCLPSCHYTYQFYVEPEDGMLSILVNMRSCDVFLGLPFNIASYALLLYIVAKMTDLHPHKVYFTLCDTHIYQNHIEQCKEQLSRYSKELPTLKILQKRDKIEDYTFQDFLIENYDPHQAISAPMAS